MGNFSLGLKIPKAKPFNLGLKAPKTKPFNLGLGSQNKKPNRDEKRTFGGTLKNRTFDNQNGKCYKCKKPVKRSHMEFHHLKFWSKGGKSKSDNCVGLCHECHKDIHDDERIKESDKKSKSKPKNNLFGGISLGSPSKRSKSPFGF